MVNNITLHTSNLFLYRYNENKVVEIPFLTAISCLEALDYSIFLLLIIHEVDNCRSLSLLMNLTLLSINFLAISHYDDLKS